MKTKTLFLTLSSVLFLAACGNIETLQSNSAKLDPNQLEKATNQYCSNNQTLKELPLEKNMIFDELDLRTRIFAFIASGSKTPPNFQDIRLQLGDGRFTFL